MSDAFTEPLSEKSNNLQPFADHSTSKENANGGSQLKARKSGFESENCPPLKVEPKSNEKTTRKSNKENQGQQDASPAGKTAKYKNMLQSLLGKEAHKSNQHQKPMSKEQQLREKVSSFFRSMEKRVVTFLLENEVSSDKLQNIQDKMTTVLDESEQELKTPEEESSDSEEEVECSGEESREPLGELSSEDKANSKDLLRSLLGAKGEQKEQVEDIQEFEIEKVIDIDANVINFGTFAPGKLLGSTLLVRNKSDQEQVVQLVVDSKSQCFEGQNTLEEFAAIKESFDQEDVFYDGRLMKKYKSDDLIGNSEKKFKCWYLENPQTKDLVKHITLKLGARCEQEFIIVVRAPSSGSQDSLLGMLGITLTTFDNNGEFLEKQIKSRKDESLTLETIERQSKMNVALFGKIDPPKIFCPRILKETTEGQKIIPVALKKASGCQKFRVPFRNEGSGDAEVEFSFIKVSETQDALLPNEFSMNEVLEFYCMPGTLKIPKDTNQILSMLIKVNYEKVKELESQGKHLKNTLLKLLLGKVKDTSVLYSFYVDIKFVS